MSSLSVQNLATGCTLAIGKAPGVVTRRQILNYLYWTAFYRPDRDALFYESSGRINQTSLATELHAQSSTITRLIQGNHEVGKTFLMRVLAWSREPDLETLLPKIRN